MKHRYDSEGILIVTPTREDVMNLKVGDLVPDCFGKWSKVTRIYARRDNVNGKAFVCFYVQWSENAEMSGALTEGETCITVPLSSKYKRSSEVTA